MLDESVCGGICFVYSDNRKKDPAFGDFVGVSLSALGTGDIHERCCWPRSGNERICTKGEGCVRSLHTPSAEMCGLQALFR